MLFRSRHLAVRTEADLPDVSLGLGLCQPPSEAMIASASFGPQVRRL
jgi:hypothetical protein